MNIVNKIIVQRDNVAKRPKVPQLCMKRDPETQDACLLEAGHNGRHDPNEFSPLKGELKLEAEVIRLQEELDQRKVWKILGEWKLRNLDAELPADFEPELPPDQRIAAFAIAFHHLQLEAQELRQVVKQYREAHGEVDNCADVPSCCCILCEKADVLIAPKVTGDKL